MGEKIAEATRDYHKTKKECEVKIDDAREKMNLLKTASWYHEQRMEAGIYS